MYRDTCVQLCDVLAASASSQSSLLTVALPGDGDGFAGRNASHFKRETRPYDCLFYVHYFLAQLRNSVICIITVANKRVASTLCCVLVSCRFLKVVGSISSSEF